MIISFVFFSGGFIALWVGILIFYHDLKSQTIPLYLLILFGFISIFEFITKHNDPSFPSMEHLYSALFMILFISLVWGIEKYKNQSLLGLGDKILLPCCALWLPCWIIPYFFIISGAIGCF